MTSHEVTCEQRLTRGGRKQKKRRGVNTEREEGAEESLVENYSTVVVEYIRVLPTSN